MKSGEYLAALKDPKLEPRGVKPMAQGLELAHLSQEKYMKSTVAVFHSSTGGTVKLGVVDKTEDSLSVKMSL